MSSGIQSSDIISDTSGTSPSTPGLIIPKILHQIWIGNKSPPIKLMNTWKEKNPDYEYIFWNEKEIMDRNMEFKCIDQINLIPGIEGKVDIMRLEILYKYGGVYVDADSICLEPLNPEIFLTNTGFAAFENEIERGNLIANVAMGFIPGHRLVKDMIDWIYSSQEAQSMMMQYNAWYSVGPAHLTRFLDTGKYFDCMTIFPSHFFLPIHFTGQIYDGHKKVFAHQFWGNTKNIYDIINDIPVPKDLLEPKTWISIIVISYNASKNHIRKCLESVRCQYGRHIGIEIVWVDDHSDQIYNSILESEFKRFLKLSRFCKLSYYKMNNHVGTEECLRKSASWCKFKLLFHICCTETIVPYRVLELCN